MADPIDLYRRYPRLSTWMKGAGHDHPYSWDWSRPEAREWGPWGSYDDLEQLLQTLHRVGPLRLPDKRRQFQGLRQTQTGYRGFRAEMTAAGYLARRQIGFDFGALGSPQPDLILRDLAIGIEVTTRSADPSREFKYELARAFREVTPKISLDLEYSAKPFAIRTKLKSQIVEEIHRAIADGQDTVYCVVRPAVNGHPATTLTIRIWPRYRFGGFFPQVRFDDSTGILKPMMADTEGALVAAMESTRKREQGASMPTILLVDISGISSAHLRSTRSWGDRLVQLIKPEHQFVGLAVMVGRGWNSDFRLILGESPHGSRSVLKDLRELERRLGLRQLVANVEEIAS